MEKIGALQSIKPPSKMDGMEWVQNVSAFGTQISQKYSLGPPPPHPTPSRQNVSAFETQISVFKKCPPPLNSQGRTPLVPLPPSFNGATFTENWSGCQFTQNSSTSLNFLYNTHPSQIVRNISFPNIWHFWDNYHIFCRICLATLKF